MSEIWRSMTQGFAQGPERVVTLDGGRTATISAYWTDDEGVSVLVDAGDEPLPARDAELLAVNVIQMAGMPGPEYAGRGLAAS
jgi:hypothetical protein